MISLTLIGYGKAKRNRGAAAVISAAGDRPEQFGVVLERLSVRSWRYIGHM